MANIGLTRLFPRLKQRPPISAGGQRGGGIAETWLQQAAIIADAAIRRPAGLKDQHCAMQ